MNKTQTLKNISGMTYDDLSAAFCAVGVQLTRSTLAGRARSVNGTKFMTEEQEEILIGALKDGHPALATFIENVTAAAELASLLAGAVDSETVAPLGTTSVDDDELDLDDDLDVDLADGTEALSDDDDLDLSDAGDLELNTTSGMEDWAAAEAAGELDDGLELDDTPADDELSLDDEGDFSIGEEDLSLDDDDDGLSLDEEPVTSGNDPWDGLGELPDVSSAQPSTSDEFESNADDDDDFNIDFDDL